MYYIANSNSITSTFRESNLKTALYLNEKMHEFANTFTLDKSIINCIDRILIIDIMIYLQGLYWDNNKELSKREKVLACLSNSEVRRCFKEDYNFSLHNSILFILMRNKNERLIRVFFFIKKMLKQLKYRMDDIHENICVLPTSIS